LKNALEVVQKNQIKPDSFTKGEMVKVVDGDLRNMVGVVVETNENQVTMMPKDCEISEMIQFLPN
jgi:transcription antitermination factor NusG